MKDACHLAEYSTGNLKVNTPVPADDACRIMDSFRGQPGLYLHVPFCESICPFCPYNKMLYDQTLAGSYFVALEREIDWYTKCTRKPFTSLYIGGGTPTLCLDELARLLARLDIAGEKAIEVLPNHASEENIARMQAMGINYLSLGIQSFDSSVLAYLGRPNTVADNHNALEACRGRFDCMDVDLIFDVSFEDDTVFFRDLETCFRAGVDQVSSYPLMRFGYTPFGKSRHSPGKEHRVLGEAESLARKYGYERRSVWTFNRSNSPRYTSITREFYLGCGAGAGSFTGQLFVLNHFSVSAYVGKVERNCLPIARLTPLSAGLAAAYYLFWQTYTGTIDAVRFDALYPGRRALKALLNIFVRAGLLQRLDGSLVLTRRGYDRYHDLERWVTYHFIEPLWANMMQEHEFLRAHAEPPGILERFWLRLAGLQ